MSDKVHDHAGTIGVTAVPNTGSKHGKHGSGRYKKGQSKHAKHYTLKRKR